MSEDGAALTRWLFEDFKHAYDAKFGRKTGTQNGVARVWRPMGNAASNDDRQPESNGGMAMNGGTRRERELAPYEKYQSQGRAGVTTEVANGGVVVVGEKKGWQKPLPEFSTLEMMALADSIMQDIVKGDLDVQWDSIKGLENAKRLLKEAVVMPIKYPQYFTGLLTPWKGILLFGPPGTGKVIIFAVFDIPVPHFHEFSIICEA